MEQEFKQNRHLNGQRRLFCNIKEAYLLITVPQKMATRTTSTFELESTIRGYHIQKKLRSFSESESLSFSTATMNHVRGIQCPGIYLEQGIYLGQGVYLHDSSVSYSVGARACHFQLLQWTVWYTTPRFLFKAGAFIWVRAFIVMIPPCPRHLNGQRHLFGGGVWRKKYGIWRWSFLQMLSKPFLVVAFLIKLHCV